MSWLELVLVTSRSLQYAAAAILGGTAVFILLGGRAAETPRSATLITSLSGLGVLGSIAWLMAQAGLLGDAPASAVDPSAVLELAAGTGFGRAASIRAGLFVLGGLAVLACRGPSRWIFAAAFGLAAAVSFVWSGHGGADGKAYHSLADAVHLVAAVVWLGAVAGLIDLTAGASTRAGALALYGGMARFSTIGVALVAVLALSGLVNGWALIGRDGLDRLLHTAWGGLLVVKLVAFAAMLACAAWNRFRHTPALAGGDPATARAASRTLWLEFALGVVVISLVACMGQLSPPHSA